MTSVDEAVVGREYYVPFWILLEFLDITPSDPFITATVTNIKYLNSMSGGQVKQVECCDLECRSRQDKSVFSVQNIPSNYLIKPDELSSWANNISKWFLDFAKT
jgi:hypothetical protein